MTITARDFGEFLWAHNQKWRCSFCDYDSFLMNVQAPDLVADLMIPVQPGGAAPSTLTHNFYTLSCRRCGNTSWFHKSAVHRWLGNRNLTLAKDQP